MFLFLINFFQNTLGIKIPAVFGYYSTRMMLAAVTSMLLSIFLGPWFIRKLYECKIGQKIRKEECPLLGELHKKKENTPTMGGVLIIAVMIVSLLLWMNITNAFTLVLLVTTIYLGAVGGYDDFLKLKYKNPRGLSSKKKFFLQAIFVVIFSGYLLVPAVTESVHVGDWFSPPTAREHVAVYNDDAEAAIENVTLSTQEYVSRLYIPFFKNHVITFAGAGLALLVIFFIFVIAGTSNAVNLTDGLDGLAIGCLFFVAVGLAFVAFVANNTDIARYLNILYIEGSGEIAIYLCSFAGACLGFLWYNGYPAQVFMGDIGSLTFGGIIGVSAVLLRREFLLAIIGAMFVIEALSVIIQVASYKLRNKKRVFLCAPIHHHFEYKGWPETKVVLRFWIISFLFAVIGIATLKFQ
ncbi:MAG: phospho-N-acetylmuramoyl-pentapeptide-transferase [Waddliaceae bacterium]|jgi:phospho-N-acetylmuramoyl-pentapeptide-transferase|nr:phospho-N-acetylmuramoyl-pentapeptide-transferase [Waddliaceae bacterium]MBT3579449.1 phospho-N-acetylmuramoyl-pentapeptide-transferase [Waddliaceae bacterium]MBT4444991.1 phospho-N-acetylmuramoyl-pentapeptide-transferase [Waddliaceae bacterium]MBT6928948.1 phospho-N-acetylmuramoyl-pentapeptide-transferase [Waddliaceae bacterium]MBT7264466.1 phospho-N-acetylmuramoyl-pentapeptide-transferase [Waddliaceae bacterium]